MSYPALNSGSSEWTAFSTRNLRSYYFVPSAYDHWLDSKTICRCLSRLRFMVRVAGACSNKMSFARPAEARICVEFVVDKWRWSRSLPSTSFLTCQLFYHQYFIFIHLSVLGWTLGLLATVAFSERPGITQQRGSKQCNVKETCTYTEPREEGSLALVSPPSAASLGWLPCTWGTPHSRSELQWKSEGYGYRRFRPPKTKYLHCHQYKLKAKPYYPSDKNL